MPRASDPSPVSPAGPSDQTMLNSEEKYRLLFHRLDEAIYLMEAEGPNRGHFVEVNEAASRMTGYSIAELLTMKVTELDVLENVERAPSRFREILEGKWIGDQIMHVRKDGTLFPVEFQAGPITLNGKKYVLSFVRDISKHVQAEQESMESKNFLHSILENVADPIFVKDREHRWIMLNDAFCAFMGRPREELIGKSDYEFFPKDQADVFWAKDEIVFKSGKVNINEESFTDAKGVPHTIITKKNTFADSRNRPLLVGIIRDITEREKAEEDSRRLAAIVAYSEDAIYAKSLEGTILSWNNGAEKLYGYSAQEIVGKHVSVLAPSTCKDEIRHILTKIKEGNYISQFQTVRVKKSGEKFDVSLTISPVKDKQGKITAASVIARDISSLKKAEERVILTKIRVEQEAQNANKFLQAVESSSIATVITTTEPKIIYANPAWETLTGYTEEEALGCNPNILKSGKTPAETYPRLWSTVLGNAEFRTEDIVNRRKNGTEYNAELRIFPIIENEKVQFLVGLQTDITLRKRSEAAKSEFMSLASHQLRTPLTGIRWGLAMLRKKGPLNPQQNEVADELQKASVRMAESINVMLHLSRIEAGKMEVKQAPLSLNTFVQSLCEEFHPQAEQMQQHCALLCEKDITLMTDEALLREIMENLLTNAIKYTPQGGTVELNVKRIDQNVRLSVRDSGYGIPQDQQDKVFSKFFRATNVTDKIPDGTGLGLYLVYALTQLLGGTISFVSQEKVGTTFTLTLPITSP